MSPERIIMLIFIDHSRGCHGGNTIYR